MQNLAIGMSHLKALQIHSETSCRITRLNYYFFIIKKDQMKEIEYSEK